MGNMTGLQGLQELFDLIGKSGQELLVALDYIFGWMFATDQQGLTHWPVLVSFVFMVIVFAVKTIRHIVHGV